MALTDGEEIEIIYEVLSILEQNLSMIWEATPSEKNDIQHLENIVDGLGINEANIEGLLEDCGSKLLEAAWDQRYESVQKMTETPKYMEDLPITRYVLATEEMRFYGVLLSIHEL